MVGHIVRHLWLSEVCLGPPWAISDALGGRPLPSRASPRPRGGGRGRGKRLHRAGGGGGFGIEKAPLAKPPTPRGLAEFRVREPSGHRMRTAPWHLGAVLGGPRASGVGLGGGGSVEFRDVSD
eukprot:8344356-Pyramimonas_sp.AAC.1